MQTYRIICNGLYFMGLRRIGQHEHLQARWTNEPSRALEYERTSCLDILALLQPVYSKADFEEVL